MTVKIPVIDDIAWVIIRLAMALYGCWFYLKGIMFPPKSLGEKAELIGNTYASWYVFGARKEDLPDLVQQIYTRQGRLLLLLIVIVISLGVVIK